MTGRGIRVLRGALTAAVSILVAALAHSAGGGTAPGLVGVALAAAFAVPACMVLAGRTLSTWRTAVAVAVSQGAFHLLFSVGAASATSVHGAGVHHGMAMRAVITPAADAGAASSMAGMHDGPGMWSAHVLAGIVTLVAVRYGEQAFWDLVRLARHGLAAIRLLLPVPPMPHLRRPLPRLATVERTDLRDLGLRLAATPHRGPPVLV